MRLAGAGPTAGVPRTPPSPVCTSGGGTCSVPRALSGVLGCRGVIPGGRGGVRGGLLFLSFLVRGSGVPGLWWEGAGGLPGLTGGCRVGSVGRAAAEWPGG